MKNEDPQIAQMTQMKRRGEREEEEGRGNSE